MYYNSFLAGILERSIPGFTNGRIFITQLSLRLTKPNHNSSKKLGAGTKLGDKNTAVFHTTVFLLGLTEY